jgi:hypothetical protein
MEPKPNLRTNRQLEQSFFPISTASFPLDKSGHTLYPERNFSYSTVSSDVLQNTFLLKVLQLHNICGRGDAGDIFDTDLQVIRNT